MTYFKEKTFFPDSGAETRDRVEAAVFSTPSRAPARTPTLRRTAAPLCPKDPGPRRLIASGVAGTEDHDAYRRRNVFRGRQAARLGVHGADSRSAADPARGGACRSRVRGATPRATPPCLHAAAPKRGRVMSGSGAGPREPVACCGRADAGHESSFWRFARPSRACGGRTKRSAERAADSSRQNGPMRRAPPPQAPQSL